MLYCDHPEEQPRFDESLTNLFQGMIDANLDTYRFMFKFNNQVLRLTAQLGHLVSIPSKFSPSYKAFERQETGASTASSSVFASQTDAELTSADIGNRGAVSASRTGIW